MQVRLPVAFHAVTHTQTLLRSMYTPEYSVCNQFSGRCDRYFSVWIRVCFAGFPARRSTHSTARPRYIACLRGEKHSRAVLQRDFSSPKKSAVVLYVTQSGNRPRHRNRRAAKLQQPRPRFSQAGYIVRNTHTRTTSPCIDHTLVVAQPIVPLGAFVQRERTWNSSLVLRSVDTHVEFQGWQIAAYASHTSKVSP